MFQAKVIEKVQSQKSGDDDVCAHPKKQRLQANQGQKSDEYCRERDALEIQRQHEEFIDSQAKKAEQYVKRKRRLMTVSSKMPVVDAADQPRPGMEGKGPRVVPQSVKNHRKRLKKKAKHQKTC